MVDMYVFWFCTALAVGSLHVMFGNILLVGIAAACMTAGIQSVFSVSLQVQLAAFLVTGILYLSVYACLAFKRGEEVDRSKVLGRLIGREVTVHFWHDGCCEVHLEGRLWPAEFVEFSPTELTAGKYHVWKLTDKKLVLTR